MTCWPSGDQSFGTRVLDSMPAACAAVSTITGCSVPPPAALFTKNSMTPLRNVRNKICISSGDQIAVALIAVPRVKRDPPPRAISVIQISGEPTFGIDQRGRQPLLVMRKAKVRVIAFRPDGLGRLAGAVKPCQAAGPQDETCVSERAGTRNRDGAIVRRGAANALRDSERFASQFEPRGIERLPRSVSPSTNNK